MPTPFRSDLLHTNERLRCCNLSDMSMDFKFGEASMLPESIDVVVSQAAEIQDDGLRRRLRDAGRKLSLAMESPGDTVHRIAYEFKPMQLALAQVGVDIRLFEILSKSETSVFSSEALAEKTNVDVALMTFPPRFDLLAPAIMAFPRLLRENEYVNPTDPTHTAFHLGMQTSRDLFHWLQCHPRDLENFNSWMSAQRETHPTFLDVMHCERELGQGHDDSTVLFVDIGGSKGHQSIALRKRYPELPGRVIVQDLAHVITEARQNPLPGSELIETEAHDMFSPQTIKGFAASSSPFPVVEWYLANMGTGARAYYLRQILHDWSNDKCKDILENLKPAMSQNSVVLIDEMVISEHNTPWRATQADFTMAIALSAKQRTEAEWRTLLDEAGFKVLRILMYREELQDCMIVATVK
ncbi:hypothetical protein FQN49_006813 [Arthroderma sp. PD_2]|nr:hypothetical protein FQN49_006813 [Arthroderma sp. PD_2]